jgi:hypothetical protein
MDTSIPTTTTTTTTTTRSHVMASQLIPLIRCPLCTPSSTLTAPVTLYCGHTVCAKHVSVPVPVPSNFSASTFQPQPHHDVPPRLLHLTPCPLNGCTTSPSSPPPPPNIPSSSRVTFSYFADGLQADRDAAAFATVPDSRTDITVNKLAVIIHRYNQQQQAPSAPRLATDPLSDSDSQTDEEISDSQDLSLTQTFTNTNIAGEASSSIPRQVSSDGSQQGPARTSARKRRRKQLLPPRRLDAPAQSADHFEKEVLAELTCEICFNLLYQPVTPPCQHVSFSIPSPFVLHRLTMLLQTFCSRCLHRSLDHGNQCPLCRHDLPGFYYFRDHPFNKTIISLSTPLDSVPVTTPHAKISSVLKAFPEAYAERGRLIEQEERHARLDTPIFVCQLSFPGLPTTLHIFQPRYAFSWFWTLPANAA